MDSTLIAKLILVFLLGIIGGTIMSSMTENVKQLKRIATVLEVLAVMKHTELEDEKNESCTQSR